MTPEAAVIDRDSTSEALPVPSAGWTLFGVELTARIVAANGAACGGDWCESFARSDGVIAFSIGDVCGHGEETFASRMAVRQAIHDAFSQGLDPGEILIQAHRVLPRHDAHKYATAIVGFLDVRQHQLIFANAGHPPPLMCGAGGAHYLDFADHDLPLGIEETPTPALRRVNVPASSLLIFYTDGVTEHDRKPLTGAAQLHDAAIFAYNFSSLPSAGVIERQMGLTNENYDDAAILTAWMPPIFGRANPVEETVLRPAAAT
jgi:serine phosphatase RsbU (regulator of sigma subunit)